MQYHRIPHSSLEVSLLGLGTMTFGEQNSEADAHAQLDYAVAAGVNLIDTAEMYPVPPKPETQGLTEQYIGSWIKARGSRDKIILASKVSGPSRGSDKPIRPNMALDRKISALRWMLASHASIPIILIFTSYIGRNGKPTVSAN